MNREKTDIIYLTGHITSISHIPIYIYSKKDKKLLLPGQNCEEKSLSLKDEKVLQDSFIFNENEEINLDKLLADVFYVSMPLNIKSKEWILVGPVLISPSPDERLKRVKNELKAISQLGIEIQKCQMESFLSGVLMLFYMVSGEKIDVAKFWERNQERFASVSKMNERLSQNVFERQERQSTHNPYNQELRELDSIQNGDVESFNRSISETYEGQIGILAKDPLRHHKNVAIGNITMASRAAVRGGLSFELAFSMADSFIQQLEEIEDISEVEVFKRAAQRAYTVAVHEVKYKNNRNNPLVEDVKNYIFSHLHDNIKIDDIAKSLRVNPDYLSHLFSESEKVTIKKYILQEKINRSKNLLCYSDYTLQEIAFYLGFSTQSYFTKTFRELVGITPGEYRKNLKKREFL